MPAWNELLERMKALPPGTDHGEWLLAELRDTLTKIALKRNGRAVVFYASAFLQKPGAPGASVMITPEDLNGFMSALAGMDCSNGLTLILHTSGGMPTAAQTIVEYLRSKFTSIEVIVPTYAMSAGTMIALASDRIVMGRPSQLGPIDPQLVLPNGSVSAQALVDQFEQAKAEIMGDRSTALAWQPIIQSMAPAMLKSATNALRYGEAMVRNWLERYMFANHSNREELAGAVAKHFNDASTHLSHGRRIGREEARQHQLAVEDLEADAELQDLVLTAYHYSTIGFERSYAVKHVLSNSGGTWYKSWSSAPMHKII
jgi:hypothetical protein